MKRSGFTMIELIFVIVILGILAAVALPKFIGVSEQANIGKFKSYAGTLARTTIAPYWGERITDGSNGALNNADMQAVFNDLPLIDGATPTNTPYLATDLEAAGFDFTNSAGVYNTSGPVNGLATYTIVTGGVTTTYTLACSQGSATTAPECNIADGTKWLIQ